MADAPAPSAAPPTTSTAPAVEVHLAHARALRLHEDEAWLALLHYDRGVLGRRSLVDDPAFFLAPDGKRDPAAELAATLRGMLDARPASPGEPDPAHPGLRLPVAARFPARAEWLCARLGIDRASLPVPGSEELDAALASFAPRSAVLVFAAGHLSSPASTFGHTLLLVRGKQESQLLAQGINYAAAVPPAGLDPFYVVKGLFGSFPGMFSAMPYHRKVQEYADLDQRDLWEYELTLDPAEVRRLLLHVWEMRGIWSSYWFFDENCSLNLLFLLEAARPGLRLTTRAGPWVQPLDTVRWVRDAGLIAGATWRPSLASRVRRARAALGDEAADRAVRIARGRVDAATAVAAESDPARRAQVLDLAGECLHALAGRRAIAPADYRTRLHATLSQRAKLGQQPALPLGDPPPRPDQGHASLRAALGGGDDDGQVFASFGVRPALHDLLDPQEGYLEGARVAMGETELRWYEGDGLRLQRLDLVGLTALRPWDGLFQRVSWEAVLGTVRERMGDEGEQRQQARGSGGVGFALRLGDGLAWALATADARGFDYGEGWALGAGASVGMVVRMGPLQVMPQASLMRYALGEESTAWELGGAGRVSPSPSLSVEVGGWRRSRWDHAWNEVAARLLFYF